MVWIDNVANTYNMLEVLANTLQFAGQLDVAINASSPGTEDQMLVTGNTNLQAGSSLQVTVNNAPPQKMKTWTIITSFPVTFKITGNFATITTNPKTPLTGQADNFNYTLTS